MADFGAPVAAEVTGPQAGIQTLSQLLGLKQQQLGIQRQQIGISQAQQELSSQTSAATIAAINAKQTQALSQINPRQYIRPDGSVDTAGLSQAAYAVAPNLASDYIGRVQNTAAATAATKKAFFDLNQEYQEPIRAAFGSFGGDPDAKISDLAATLEAYKETLPKSAQGSVGTIIQQGLGLLSGPSPATGQPRSPQEQKAMALAFSRLGLSPSEVAGPGGISTPQAGTVSTGTSIIPTTTNRQTGITSAANAPPVAAQSMIVTLPSGQQGILDLTTGRIRIAGTEGAKPGTSAPLPPMNADNDPARPPPNAPAASWAQWNASLTQAQAAVQAARNDDTQMYGNNMAIAQQIRALSHTAAGKDVGPGTAEWTRLIGTITSRFGGSAGVTDVQTLESFLDRQAASMSRAMGVPPTNLGNEQARIISGNIGMQVGALRAKNDYNEALAQGLHDYRTGLDLVAGPAGNASPTAVGQFRNEWSKYYNPMAYEYKLAQERGDRKVMDAIAKSVTPGQAKRMKFDLMMTEALATTGKLP